jgi:hypothetical protein
MKTNASVTGTNSESSFRAVRRRLTNNYKTFRVGMFASTVGATLLVALLLREVAAGWSVPLSGSHAVKFEAYRPLLAGTYGLWVEVTNPGRDDKTEQTTRANIQSIIGGRLIRIDSLHRSSVGRGLQVWYGGKVRIPSCGVYKINVSADPVSEPVFMGQKCELIVHRYGDDGFETMMLFGLLCLISIIFLVSGGGIVLYAFFSRKRERFEAKSMP